MIHAGRCVPWPPCWFCMFWFHVCDCPNVVLLVQLLFFACKAQQQQQEKTREPNAVRLPHFSLLRTLSQNKLLEVDEPRTHTRTEQMWLCSAAWSTLALATLLATAGGAAAAAATPGSEDLDFGKNFGFGVGAPLFTRTDDVATSSVLLNATSQQYSSACAAAREALLYFKDIQRDQLTETPESFRM